MSSFRPRFSSWRLHLLGAFLINCLLAMLILSGRTATAQGAATSVTPTPAGQVLVMQPQLDPAYTGDTFPDGWLKIVGKSAFTIYMAPGRSAADGADGEMRGSWRPAIVEAGYYRVEAYLDARLLREYRAMFPQTQPVEFELTESARYEVHHADGVTSVERSQNLQQSDWIDLGIYRFEAGGDGYVALSNLVNGVASSSGILNSGAFAAVAFSAVRFTPAEPPSTATATPTNTATPESTATPTPSLTMAEVEALAFGELSETETDDRFEVEAPFSINDTPVGVMDISYPKQISAAQADNIQVDIVVTGEFTSSVTLAVRDLTQDEELDPLVASSQFLLTLDAQTLEYGDETQRVSIRTRRETGAAWNVTPAEGVVGEQPFNIKLVLNVTDGIPELSGPPLSFIIDVLAVSAPPVSPLASPTPGAGEGEGAGSLPILWFFLLIALVALVGFFIFRRRRALPLALGRGPDWSVLGRGILAILESQFSQSEFQALCFNLGVQFEDLRGDHRAAKMQSFVAMMRRHNRLPQLITALAELDPDRIVNWRPVKQDLLSILVDRSEDGDFRAQLAGSAAQFTDEAFRSEVRALLAQLGEEDSRRRIKAVLDGEEEEGAGEVALLVSRLQQHLDGNVNIPQLVGAMIQAEEESEAS